MLGASTDATRKFTSAAMVRTMHNGQKQSADAYSANPGSLINLIPIVKASNPEEVNGFDLIDRAAELIRASEQRALHAEEKAEKVSAKAVEAVRATQLRIQQTQAQAQLLEHHAAEQVRLAVERIAKAEALATERIEQAQVWAEEAEERARAAESQLQAAEARASDAEERLEQLNQALRRKLSANAHHAASVTQKIRSLN
jgi:hypothetical protein